MDAGPVAEGRYRCYGADAFVGIVDVADGRVRPFDWRERTDKGPVPNKEPRARRGSFAAGALENASATPSTQEE